MTLDCCRCTGFQKNIKAAKTKVFDEMHQSLPAQSTPL